MSSAPWSRAISDGAPITTGAPSNGSGSDAAGASASNNLAAFSSHNLSSIMNNPDEVGASSSWMWPFGVVEASTGGDEEFTPLVPTVKLPEVMLTDFEKYLRLVRDRYPRFLAAREATAKASASQAEKKGTCVSRRRRS